MKFYIKNMVCSRCKMVVKAELEKAGLHPLNIELGEVEVDEKPDAATIISLDNSLKRLGFEMFDDRKSRIIEQIKTAVISLVHYNKEQCKLNLSSYLSQQLNYDYGHLSNLFSDVEGSTIEKYFIAQKTEK